MQRKKRQSPHKGVELNLPKLNLKMPPINPAILALSILAVLLLIFNIFIIPKIKPRPVEQAQPKPSLETIQTVRNTLAQFGIYEDDISFDGTMTQVLIPRDFSFFTFYAVLRSELDNIGAEIIESQKTDDGITMKVGKDERVSEELLFSKSRRVQTRRGQAAIIIDDFGYSANKTARDFLMLNVPLTVSIIPGLDHSQRLAELANLQGKEVMIHMPMQPKDQKVPDDGFLLYPGLAPGRVSMRLRQAFAQIPMADGLNNHQGSLATADADLMNTVMITLQGMDKFFIDSWTSPQSVAFETAKQHNVPTARNKIFIDANDDKTFIRNQLNLLAKQAKEQGDVIAIGHVRKRTLAVLQEMIPILKASGVTFVNASDLVN
jgi:polysaccharide deacetylase 2 family uncharacterized protein YibQ